jgi:hypothetical protein
VPSAQATPLANVTSTKINQRGFLIAVARCTCAIQISVVRDRIEDSILRPSRSNASKRPSEVPFGR